MQVFLQALQVIAGGVQTVDVIDPQAGRAAAAYQVEQEAVDFVEDFGILHPQCGELVHVEEPAVVDLFGRDAPVCQAVRLFVQ